MRAYLEDGIFSECKDSYIYVERELLNGKIRRGIVAEIDLDAYEFSPEKSAPIKATEKTVEERLEKRIDLRRNASLELPHILVFYNDPEGEVLSSIEADKGELLYSFRLMQGGGHIEGRLVEKERALRLSQAFEELERKAQEKAEKSGAESAAVLAVGDGNHSLATAKAVWEEKKESLNSEERARARERYALVELVNIFDEGINMEPIHRVVKNTESRGFAKFIEEYFRGLSSSGEARTLTAGTGEGKLTFAVSGLDTGEIVRSADRAVEEYIKLFGGEEDYVHDAADAERIGSDANAAFILLPEMIKEEVFKTVSEHRILPKKCFSIGHAREKRYYLEARRIKQ